MRLLFGFWDPLQELGGGKGKGRGDKGLVLRNGNLVFKRWVRERVALLMGMSFEVHCWSVMFRRGGIIAGI